MINSDGSITPANSSITHVGDIYTFTGDITGSLTVHESNIVIDGNGFTLEGPGGMGIWLNQVNNVTIKNLNVDGFSMSGIYLTGSCNDTIYNNSLSSNDYCGIRLRKRLQLQQHI